MKVSKDTLMKIDQKAKFETQNLTLRTDKRMRGIIKGVGLVF